MQIAKPRQRTGLLQSKLQDQSYPSISPKVISDMIYL